ARDRVQLVHSPDIAITGRLVVVPARGIHARGHAVTFLVANCARSIWRAGPGRVSIHALLRLLHRVGNQGKALPETAELSSAEARSSLLEGITCPLRGCTGRRRA